MKRLFLRGLPILMALTGALLAWLQWSTPLSYPWPLLGILVTFILFAFFLSFRCSTTFVEAVHLFLPTVVVIVATGLGMLLAEQPYERVVLTLILSGIPAFALELYYLANYDPTKYPVNGLSRLNIALVPVIAFLGAIALYGMQVFLRLNSWYSLLSFPLAAAALYFVTSHPTAEQPHRLRWSMVGAIAGLHAAILVLLLPVSLAVHGAIAVTMIAAPLRVRRYAHSPAPSRRVAYTEGISSIVLFLAILLTSRWS